MQLTMRPYEAAEDYWQIRQFLRQLFLYNERVEYSWQAFRFDYWRWHGLENIEKQDPAEVFFLWEGNDGRLGAVLTHEGRGHAHLLVDPRLRTAELDEEMVAVAERALIVPQAESGRRLTVWVNETDEALQRLLQARGYCLQGNPEHRRRRLLSEPIAEAAPPPGFTLRSLHGREELPARSWLSWRAFHPEERDEKYEGWQWYENVQRAPLYRQDLDLVAVAPDGELAAFCTVWFDDVTLTAGFEPVGVEPRYHRRGLGKAVMAEGLRRAQWLGATLASVGSYSEAAGALYEAMGFTDTLRSYPWVKQDGD